MPFTSTSAYKIFVVQLNRPILLLQPGLVAFFSGWGRRVLEIKTKCFFHRRKQTSLVATSLQRIFNRTFPVGQNYQWCLPPCRTTTYSELTGKMHKMVKCRWWCRQIPHSNSDRILPALWSTFYPLYGPHFTRSEFRRSRYKCCQCWYFVWFMTMLSWFFSCLSV